MTLSSVQQSPLRGPRLQTLLTAAFGVYAILYIVVYALKSSAGQGPPFGDFFAFWSVARFVQTLPAAQVYDVQTLQAFQHALPGQFHSFYPFPYPPSFLLCLWPLGALAYLPAYGLWLAATLGAYLFAVAGGDWRSTRLWLTLAAPTTLLTAISGQNGFLTAALMIGGLRLLARRPVLGGVILGGLAFKPQLFLLVPLVLLAAGQWRALAGLALSGAAQLAITSVVFGPLIWLRWVQAIPTLSRLFEDNRARLGGLMPTITGALRHAGLGAAPAMALQLIAAVAVAVSLWLLFRRAPRRGGPGPLDAAAVQAGAFLVTPYAFIYDMPMVTSAIVTTMDSRPMSSWRTTEIAVLLAALVLPIVIMGGGFGAWPIGPVVLIALFGLIARQAWASSAPA